ncbi:MAG: hypothetical protein GY703_01875 [Gammaproteobacteria bacterium]|nr:hypothetical protein [Gammaproteobacteria bacterium]
MAASPGRTASRSSVKTISDAALAVSRFVMVKVRVDVPPGTDTPSNVLVRFKISSSRVSLAGLPVTARPPMVPVTWLVVLIEEETPATGVLSVTLIVQKLFAARLPSLKLRKPVPERVPPPQPDTEDPMASRPERAASRSSVKAMAEAVSVGWRFVRIN